MSTNRRGELTDEQWQAIAGFLPPERGRAGRPAKDHRLMINGMLWVLRTGAPWRDLPERYGPWQSVYTRFRRWTQCGLWQKILEQVQAEADEAGQVDWEVHYLDGTVVRAHVSAAGAKKGRPTRP